MGVVTISVILLISRVGHEELHQMFMYGMLLGLYVSFLEML